MVTTGELTRNDARWLILRTVNKFCLVQHRRRQHRAYRILPTARLYGMRHIQEAVCIARRNRLIPADVLDVAGFRPGPKPVTAVRAQAA